MKKLMMTIRIPSIFSFVLVGHLVGHLVGQ